MTFISNRGMLCFVLSDLCQRRFSLSGFSIKVVYGCGCAPYSGHPYSKMYLQRPMQSIWCGGRENGIDPFNGPFPIQVMICAIRPQSPHRNPQTQTQSAKPEAMLLLRLREIKLMRHFSHPNVLQLHEVALLRPLGVHGWGLGFRV